MTAAALTFETARLLSALREVRAAVQRRSTGIPVLANVLVEASDGTVRLSATDLDVMVSRTLPAEVGAAVAFTLDANRLADVVGTFASGSQTTIRYEAPAATVSSGRARLRFATLPADQFPHLTQKEVVARFSIDAKALARGINAVRHAICADEVRYYLNGIFWHHRDGKLVYAATDGHRLARYVDDLPAGAADLPDTILRTRCIELARAAAESRDVPVEVSVGDQKVTMVAGDYTLVAKVVDGTYPDYTRIFPQGNDRVVELDRDAFAEALERVAVASSEKVRVVKLELERDLIRASITSPEHGVSVDELACSYAAEPMVIGFNSRFLRDALAIFDTDQVDLTLGDAATPAIITSPKASGVTLVLGPFAV